MTGLDDPARLRALEATRLLDSPAEAAFDRLTSLAVLALEAPIALVSLVTDDRQFFKSQCGLPPAVADQRGTPLSHSFCQHVVISESPLIAGDARNVPALADNLAISDLGVIAYAGFPLVGAGGEVLGSFCAIDTQVKTWTERHLAMLEHFAAATVDLMDMRAAGQATARGYSS